MGRIEELVVVRIEACQVDLIAEVVAVAVVRVQATVVVQVFGIDAAVAGAVGKAVAGDLECVLGTDARARMVAEEICQRVSA